MNLSYTKYSIMKGHHLHFINDQLLLRLAAHFVIQYASHFLHINELRYYYVGFSLIGWFWTVFGGEEKKKKSKEF